MGDFLSLGESSFDLGLGDIALVEEPKDEEDQLWLNCLSWYATRMRSSRFISLLTTCNYASQQVGRRRYAFGHQCDPWPIGAAERSRIRPGSVPACPAAADPAILQLHAQQRSSGCF